MKFLKFMILLEFLMKHKYFRFRNNTKYKIVLNIVRYYRFILHRCLLIEVKICNFFIINLKIYINHHYKNLYLYQIKLLSEQYVTNIYIYIYVLEK